MRKKRGESCMDAVAKPSTTNCDLKLYRYSLQVNQKTQAAPTLRPFNATSPRTLLGDYKRNLADAT